MGGEEYDFFDVPSLLFFLTSKIKIIMSTNSKSMVRALLYADIAVYSPSMHTCTSPCCLYDLFAGRSDTFISGQMPVLDETFVILSARDDGRSPIALMPDTVVRIKGFTDVYYIYILE